MEPMLLAKGCAEFVEAAERGPCVLVTVVVLVSARGRRDDLNVVVPLVSLPER